MNTNSIYYPPIQAKRTSTRQDEKWDEAVAFFKNKQYTNILPALLEYVDANLKNKKSANTYEIAHGSVIIYITQTKDELLIECPFLNIENAKKVPLMRRLIEMRMFPLNLTNVELKEDLVYFTFSSPLSLCEPYKIYNVLREICYYADSYDDEFIEKFNAEHLQEPKTIPFPNDLKTAAYANYQNIITEGLKRFNLYLENRHHNNAFYTLNSTFKKIDFYAEPQGYLRSVIEKSVNDLFNQNIPFQQRLLNGKANLEKLSNYSKEKVLESLYKIEVFIPHKYSGKKENIRDNWEENYNDVQEMIGQSMFEDAANIMLSCFYSLFYYNLVDESISKPITDALAQASGLDWNQAAPVLLKGMQAIMEDTLFDNNYGMDLSKIMGEQMQQSMALMQQMMANFKTN